MAALANVSGCTVSYVLTGRQDVVIADATRARVIAAARQLGYKPNRAARALVTGTTHVISLLAGRLTPYYMALTNQLQDLAKADGYQVLICDADMGGSDPAPGLWTGDGIIAIDYPEHIEAYLQTHPDLRTPLVSIGAFHLEQADFVGVDLYTGARKAVEHLVQIGCRRIVYVHAEAPRGLNDPRTPGFADAMAMAGRIPEQALMPGPTRRESRQGICDYVKVHGCPDGLFCHNDETAIGVYRGLCDMGISVPSQVKIVGCDGIEDTEYLECPITTIMQPIDQVCRTGWEFLMRRISEPSIPAQKQIFQSELVIRKSTAPECADLSAEREDAPQ